jgi:hypothetical protein
MSAKTQELCRTILKKSLPTVDLTQLQKLSSNLVPERSRTPQPTLPVPIVPISGSTPHSLDTNVLEDTDLASRPLLVSFDKIASVDPGDIDQSPFFTLENENLIDFVFGRLENDYTEDECPLLSPLM